MGGFGAVCGESAKSVRREGGEGASFTVVTPVGAVPREGVG